MKIGVAGYRGRVGQLLVSELQSDRWKPLELSGGGTRTVHPEHYPDESFPIFTNVHDLMQASDCVIDFTAPESTLPALEAAISAKTGMVIGTTGLNAQHEQTIEEAAKHIPIVYAANMSIGVNLLLALVEQATAKLGPAWDIEIFEAHHKNKIDAPSGTALVLGRAAQKGRGAGSFVTDRAGKRMEGDIGYAVSRGGDVVGEHTVTLYGMGERIELGHKASDRSLFARGALQAAVWLEGKKPSLYTMRDVLGL